MKKYLSVGLLLAVTFALVSWGYKGHRTTALIAENYLSPQAKASVKYLLGNETLADVSTWADDIRNDPQYKNTASWHYLNLPLGLSFEKFGTEVYSQSKDNILTAIQRCEGTLSDVKASREQKKEALKFLVHFIGDAHQPMHVSRSEDKGGNTIQVQFDGKGTNLHSLWDSGLIDYSGLSETQLVAKITADWNKKSEYRKDRPMQWLWESYSLSSQLYAEVAKNNKLDASYYTTHFPMVEERLMLGGLRLANVLNIIFAQSPIVNEVNSTSSTSAQVVLRATDVHDAANHIGESVTITSKAYSSRDMGSMVLVNLGAAYPNQLLTVVLRGEAKALGKGIDGKTITVSGKLIDYKGKPEIIVTDNKQLSVGFGETIDTDRQGG